MMRLFKIFIKYSFFGDLVLKLKKKHVENAKIFKPSLFKKFHTSYTSNGRRRYARNDVINKKNDLKSRFFYLIFYDYLQPLGHDTYSKELKEHKIHHSPLHQLCHVQL